MISNQNVKQIRTKKKTEGHDVGKIILSCEHLVLTLTYKAFDNHEKIDSGTVKIVLIISLQQRKNTFDHVLFKRENSCNV